MNSAIRKYEMCLSAFLLYALGDVIKCDTYEMTIRTYDL